MISKIKVPLQKLLLRNFPETCYWKLEPSLFMKGTCSTHTHTWLWHLISPVKSWRLAAVKEALNITQKKWKPEKDSTSKIGISALQLFWECNLQCRIYINDVLNQKQGNVPIYQHHVLQDDHRNKDCLDWRGFSWKGFLYHRVLHGTANTITTNQRRFQQGRARVTKWVSFPQRWQWRDWRM